MDAAILKRFMNQAWLASESSPCVKKHVGAVLVDIDDMAVVGAGYGGDIHACDPKDPCGKKIAGNVFFQDGCFAVHAELRAMFSYMNGRMFIDPVHTRNVMDGLTMFVTHGPCDQCMKYMSYFGVSRVIYDEPYKVDYQKWAGRGIQVWHNMERII